MVALALKLKEFVAMFVKDAKWFIFVEPCAKLLKGGIAEDETRSVKPTIVK